MDGSDGTVEAAAAAERAIALKPRDAATLIIIDASNGPLRILFGKRRMDQKFMPGKYVFPGGRVDPTDLKAPLTAGLADSELAKLLRDIKGRPSARRVNSFALAAVRETFEETGLVLGQRDADTAAAKARRVGSDAWKAYLAHGVMPDLSRMTFVARAITPPGKPRRYDTRFFCVDAGEIAVRTDSSDGELTETHWLTVDEAKQFDLPTVQRAILEDMTDRLGTEGRLAPSAYAVPFYHMKNGTFRRDLLTVEKG